MSARRRESGSLVLAIFAVIWTAGVAGADFMYAHFLVRQARTAGFARTDGEITASDVTTSWTPNRDAKVHGVELAYTYVVGGRTFHGSRYRVSAAKESGSWAADLVRQLPVGARVVVHYAPEDPSEAVLRAGLSAADAYPVFILFPVNGLALALWRAFREERLRRRRYTTGGLRIVEAGNVTRVLPEAMGPAGTALLWAGFANFVLAIVVGVMFGLEPPAGVVVSLLAQTFLFAALGWWSARRRIRSGAKELVIDTGARTLRLPSEKRAAPPPPIPWASIVGLVLERRKVETERESTWEYWVAFSRADRTTVNVGMATWNERESAERFRAWLAERIGLPSERAIVAASP